MANASIEEIAQKAPGRLWFQLYVLYDREFTDKMVGRAEAAGYEALVITVDAISGGKRERDLRNGFAVPFRIKPKHVLEGAARALEILADELKRSMQLCGVRSVAEIGPHLLAASSGAVSDRAAAGAPAAAQIRALG